jgi:hypothetical protein
MGQVRSNKKNNRSKKNNDKAARKNERQIFLLHLTPLFNVLQGFFTITRKRNQH